MHSDNPAEKAFSENFIPQNIPKSYPLKQIVSAEPFWHRE